MKFWLVKSEPETFSIDDLKASPQRTTCWDGVRNYQARNFMREMTRGDLVFFYHSNCPEPGITGIATVAKEAYPDHTAVDPDDKHYDPKSDPDKPRWYMVDLKYKRKLRRTISLRELKTHAHGALQDLLILRRGNRLSVIPVEHKHWNFILELE